MPIYPAFLFSCKRCGKSDFIALPPGTGLKDAAGTLNDEGWDISVKPHDINCHEYCPECAGKTKNQAEVKEIDKTFFTYGMAEEDENPFDLKYNENQNNLELEYDENQITPTFKEHCAVTSKLKPGYMLKNHNIA